MVAVSQKERAALLEVERANTIENQALTMWRIVGKNDKVRALSLAGMDRNRHSHGLDTFTAEERRMMYASLSNHITHMRMLMQIMDSERFAQSEKIKEGMQYSRASNLSH